MRLLSLLRSSFSGHSQVGSTLDGNSVLATVAGFELHAGAFSGGRIERHHVAQVDRGVLLQTPALRVPLAGAHVLPDAVDPFDDDAVLVGEDAEDAAGLAFVSAGDDDDGVACF